MGDTLDYLKMFAQFPVSLRRFMRQPITLEDARRIVTNRLEQRNENFLAVAERSIYGYPNSPYLPLLKMAGCEFGDLRELVRQKGLEPAITVLRQAGVYVTFEELKGRKPIVRHDKTFQVKPADFDNPHTTRMVRGESGGSSGAATQVGQDLEYLTDRAPHIALANGAYNTYDIPFVMWRGILPDVGTLTTLMRRASLRLPTTRWFSNVGLRDSAHWIKYGMATYYMVFWMRVFGMPAPWPEYAAPDEAEIVARSVLHLRDTHGRCLLSAQVSRALRVCLAAERLGKDLTGVTITAGGEAPTPAKVSAIRRSGAQFFSNYSMSEAGTLGFSCAASEDPGDLHFFTDAHAIISYPYKLEKYNVTVPAINLTTLLPTSPKILFNLQIDDYGTLEQRSCGCALETYGYTTHLRNVRSYHKLTGEGVTLIGNDMVHILEDILPTRFGGTALDYQLMEQEDENGFTRLYLVIHPQVGFVDESAVIALVLDELRRVSPMADAARIVWQKAGTLQVQRAAPVWTLRGKFLPLHLPGNTVKPKSP